MHCFAIHQIDSLFHGAIHRHSLGHGHLRLIRHLCHYHLGNYYYGYRCYCHIYSFSFSLPDLTL
ncbi:hypothetical protein CTI10_010130 [Delftia acidovorans]|uniref:Uncharacterized protein n=1 Tax=Chryseobacterium sp. B5 TaxID=2050562 RepID=A0A2G7T933_9FLAO|nr:hypothetical protein CTI10_010130 [Delftia acidovorans]